MSDGPQDGEGSSIWDRLRRRKVVQWGIAYAAGAWGLLQGLQFLTDAFEWPSHVLRLATVVLVLGLPIALVLAWFHGDRGQRRISRAELAIVTTLFLIGGGLFWYYQHKDLSLESSRAAKAPGTPAPPTALPADRSIAVLPFVNMSADQEQEYFADGISEELLNLLTQVPDLRVIARTSSFFFKGKEADIATIARTLHVAHVLEGSVRKSGDKLRITAQLIRATDSSHLWSQTYDRQLTDVFAVQDEIAAAVVEQLKIKLLGHAPESKATDPKAYALFLQARDIFRQGSTDASARARQMYQQALAIDSRYPAAWVGLADTYYDDVIKIVIPADEGMRLAREAIEKALALDPEFGAAHASLGGIALDYDLDLATAARRLERAMALEPSNPDIIVVAAALSRRLGRLDQAIALGKYQMALDPVNAEGCFQLGLAYRYAGRLDEALAEFRTVLSLTPGRAGLHETIGGVLLQKGDAQAALAEIQRESADQWRLPALSVAYFALGQKAESDAALDSLIRKFGTINAEAIAAVFAYRGEADRAFEWLNKAADNHEPGLTPIAAYPWYAGIHSDPRWLPFLRRIGMAPEQLAAITFDVKLPK